MENHVPVISGLLGRWLSADDVPTASTSAVGEVLDRLIAATQVRYPVIGDIARNLRFRLFDEPQIAKAREQIYDGVRDGLQYLADHPDAPDYAARINELLDTPELLIDLLAERISSPGALLEVITRRYYEIRALEDVKTFDKAGGQFVTGSYELAGEQLHLVSTVTDRARLSATLDTIDEIAGPKADNLVVDIYLSWPDAPTDGDEISAALAEVLAAHPSTSSWRRVTVTVVGAGSPSDDVPSGARRWPGGGPDHPRHAPAHRATPRFVADEELRRHSPARRGGNVPVPRGGQRESVR